MATDRTANNETSPLRRVTVKALVPLYLFVMAATPMLVVAALFSAVRPGAGQFIAFAISIPVAFFTFALTCAVLSMPTRSAVVRGRFPRDLGHKIYGPRRLYALCWTTLYYCGPAYHAVLAVPLFKQIIFRLFGYKGSLDIQIYPDTWLRDLPLLQLQAGAYLSNKSTIGTNMCLTNGEVIVEPVCVERGAMVGHMVMLGPGCRIREGAEIGVGAGIGIHTDVGARAKIGPCAIVNHGARIGADAEIGLGAYIGHRALIGPGVTVGPGIVIPDRARVRTQKDAVRYIGTRSNVSREFAATRDSGAPDLESPHEVLHTTALPEYTS